MHVVIALFGGIAIIFYVLNHFGVDIGWLNPVWWRRRRQWAAKYQGDPVYSIEDPLHVAALLIIGVAKLEGDLTAEQKQAVRDQFSEKFSMGEKETSELLGSAAHLLAAPQLIGAQLRTLAERSQSKLSSEQAESMLAMMDVVAGSEGSSSSEQREYVEGMRTLFMSQDKGDGPWKKR
jgi:hypothetical protein